MIEPNYTTTQAITKISLEGRVLVFGSGKLTHEDAFFDYSSATEVRCYDPLYQTDSEKPAGRDGKFSFYSKFEEARNSGGFDHIVALFSLHYEPAWIPALSRLISALKLQGKFYYAEDCGFRAVLDGTTADEAIHSSALHVQDVFQKRHHRSGAQNENGSPWLPSIRASDYKQLAILLGVFGFQKTAEPLFGTFQRAPGAANLQEEARPYLPWKAGAELLENTYLGATVSERVGVHQYVKAGSLEFPETLLYDSPAAEIVRSLVFKRTTEAMAQLELILPPATARDEELDGVYSRLTSFGRAWLSVLYQHIARQVPEIEAVQLIFQRVGDHEDMVEALTSYEFAEQPVFLTCTRAAERLEPWDYEITERYKKYAQKLKDENLGYLAKPIFESGTLGVYWNGGKAEMVEARSAGNLSEEFSSRAVPSPCLYIPARIAHVERGEKQEPRPLTLIAMIVYFRVGSSLTGPVWRNLHSLLLPLLDNVSARIALGEMLAGHQYKRLLMERERSHQMLMKLQMPLDELTRAFDKVQAEAHEMQAILNSPEESLFRAQKLVADIFVDQGDIKVSATLTATPEHSPGDLEGDNLRMIYVLVLCSIFGKRNELLAANSASAVLGHGRDVLREAERSPVFDDVCGLLRVITGANTKKVGIWETIDVLAGEDEAKRDERQQRVLEYLKVLLFTPFKDFSNTGWPKSPIYVAVKGKDVAPTEIESPRNESDWERRLQMEHRNTPFPQHAILDFILAAKGEYQHRTVRNRFVSVDTPPPTSPQPVVVSIHYEGGSPFFQSAKGTNLFSFLRHAAQHGVAGRNYGNFLGCFARLLRHAQGLGSDSKLGQAGEWSLIEPSTPNVLLAVERMDKARFFWIEDTFTDGKGVLKLVWSACGWENTALSPAERSADEARAGIVSTPKPTFQGNAENESEEILCFVSDHRPDGPWANSLAGIGTLSGRLGKLRVNGTELGKDSPDSLNIPDGTKVLILHTKQNLEVWCNALGSRYGIVRVSTTGDPKVPADAPAHIVALSTVLNTDFGFSESAPQRIQAQSALLRAVTAAARALNQPRKP